MRLSTSASTGPAAPDRDSLPISSWSNAATTVIRSLSVVAISAVSAACTLDRLSSRPEARNSSVGPKTSGGVVAYADRSEPSISPTSQPASRAICSMIVRSGRLTLQTGAVCSWRSSFTPVLVRRPVEVDGQLRDAHDRPGADQPLLAAGEDHPTGQPELAVQPGVEQRAAVDLHPQLLPAGRTDVGPGLQHEARVSRCARRRSGTGCQGRLRSGSARRAPPRPGRARTPPAPRRSPPARRR